MANKLGQVNNGPAQAELPVNDTQEQKQVLLDGGVSKHLTGEIVHFAERQYHEYALSSLMGTAEVRSSSNLIA